MYIPKTDQLVEFKALCQTLMEADEVTLSQEGLLSTLANGLVRGLTTIRNDIESIFYKSTDPLTPDKFKNLLVKHPSYLSMAKATVTNIDYFKGQLAPFSKQYVAGTAQYAGEYLTLLESYSASLIEMTGSGDYRKAHYSNLLQQFLVKEGTFNRQMEKYFKGNTRDMVRLSEVLPNEGHALDFATVIHAYRDHPLITRGYYAQAENLIEVASVGLNTLANKNQSTDTPAPSTLIKALARDGFAIAEIATSMTGRGHTLHQLRVIYNEVVELIQQS
jgi:hypothetical protein